ncbi:hypothetical protein CMV_006561 [Castanea mollissima]|uniref:Uncharacterized protein n=1 Tax=Castanea mollissima TaxID=60419 RepID=A0A8J4VTH4_9ROSI|nr:hypothetical protein CMV_006561 [Castanea mollissima]
MRPLPLAELGLTSRLQVPPGLICPPPPGTAAAQIVMLQLFLISNLAAWANKAMKIRVLTKQQKEMDRFLKGFILESERDRIADRPWSWLWDMLLKCYAGRDLPS